MNDETRPITTAKDETMTEHDLPADTTYLDEPHLDEPEATETEPESGRHPVNVTQLVMAVAFAGMLLIWALWVTDVVQGSDFNWLMPIPWLAAGAAGLIASVRPWRK